MLPPLLLSLALSAHADDAPERVVVPLGQYLDLYDRTKAKPPEPSRQATLSSAQLTGVVVEGPAGASAEFTATVRVEVHTKDGFVRVPMLSTRAALLDATIDGRDAPIAVDNPFYTLVTDRKGAFDVQMRFAVPVDDDNGLQRLAFQIPAAGATTVELAVPSADPLAFDIPGGVPHQSSHSAGRSVLRTSIPATGTLTTTWRRAVAAEEAREPRVYADVHTLVTVGDGLVRARATIYETVLFAGVDTFQVRIPDGMTVLDVTGAGLSDWTLDGGVLTAKLGYAAEGAWSFAVSLERPLGADEALQAPIPIPIGVARVTGFVGVESRGNQEITSTGVTGAAAVDVRTLPASILGVTEQPVLLGFKHLGASPEVPLAVKSYEEVDVLVTLIDQAVANTRWTRDGRRLTSVQYEVRNNRRQYLRLNLPEGAELWSAAVAGKAVQPARAPGGEVLLPLVRSQTDRGSLAAFPVQVVYVESGAPPSASGSGTFSASLPTADVPVTWLGWSVWAPYEAKVPSPKKMGGTLQPVAWLNPPFPTAEAYQVEDARVTSQSNAQIASGGLGEGAAPVPVTFPLEGQQLSFEKMLVLDEPLTVSFTYRGLK